MCGEEEERGRGGLTELLSGDWLRWSVGRPRGGYSRGDIRVTWALASGARLPPFLAGSSCLLSVDTAASRVSSPLAAPCSRLLSFRFHRRVLGPFHPHFLSTSSCVVSNGKPRCPSFLFVSHLFQDLEGYLSFFWDKYSYIAMKCVLFCFSIQNFCLILGVENFMCSLGMEIFRRR